MFVIYSYRNDITESHRHIPNPDTTLNHNNCRTRDNNNTTRYPRAKTAAAQLALSTARPSARAALAAQTRAKTSPTILRPCLSCSLMYFRLWVTFPSECVGFIEAFPNKGSSGCFV